MAVDDTLHGRQADAGSRKIPGVMQPLKRQKQLVGIGHVKAGAVIAHEINRFALLLFDTELDAGFRDPSRIFSGVADEVFQGQPEEPGIGCDIPPLGNASRQQALGLSLARVHSS